MAFLWRLPLEQGRKAFVCEEIMDRWPLRCDAAILSEEASQTGATRAQADGDRKDADEAQDMVCLRSSQSISDTGRETAQGQGIGETYLTQNCTRKRHQSGF